MERLLYRQQTPYMLLIWTENSSVYTHCVWRSPLVALRGRRTSLSPHSSLIWTLVQMSQGFLLETFDNGINCCWVLGRPLSPLRCTCTSCSVVWLISIPRVCVTETSSPRTSWWTQRPPSSNSVTLAGQWHAPLEGVSFLSVFLLHVYIIEFLFLLPL